VCACAFTGPFQPATHARRIRRSMSHLAAPDPPSQLGSEVRALAVHATAPGRMLRSAHGPCGAPRFQTLDDDHAAVRV